MTKPRREIVPAGKGSAVTGRLARRGLALLRSRDTTLDKTDLQSVRANLLPYLLPLSGPNIIENQTRPPELQILYRTTCDGLVVTLAQNEPDRVAYVQRANMMSWGMSEEEAWAVAASNLDSHLDDIIMVLQEVGFIRVLGWNDPRETVFAATLVLSKAFRRLLCQTLGSKYCYVGIPHNQLLVAMVPSYEDIADVASYCRREAVHNEHRISSEFYLIQSSGDWERITDWRH